MKKLYSFLATTFAVSATMIAQPTLTEANVVHAIGDQTDYYMGDSNTVTVDPTIGANVVFDYTNAEALGVNQTDFYVDPATTPGATDFSTADFAQKTNLGDTNYIYTIYSADSMNNIGFIADITGFGVVTAKYDVDPEITLKFPFNYGDSYSDNYAGSFNVDYNGFPVNTDGEGVVTVDADAWGRLDLPNGVSFDEVIRVKRVEDAETDTIVLPGFPNPTIILPVHIDATAIMYYKPSVSKSPLMSFVDASYTQDGQVIQENKTIASQYPLLTTAVTDIDFANELILAPNPTKGVSVLQIPSDVSGTIEVKVLNGLGQTVKNVYSGSSVNRLNVSVEGLNAGIYFVNIEVEGKRAIKKLIVE